MKEVVFIAKDGKKIFCSLWDKVRNPIGVVQMIHGMDEHIRRYDRFAQFLNANGYIVFGDDHRAHGRTAQSISKIGQPDGDPDLFESIKSDEIAIMMHLKKEYQMPLVIFGHSYGSFITQKLLENKKIPVDGVCLSGSAKYPMAFLLTGLIPSFIGQKLFGPDAPARLIEYFSPIRGDKNGVSKLTRDKQQAKMHDEDIMHVKNFSYGFYYSMFKNLIKLSGQTNPDIPLLIISGSKDPVSLNSLFAKNLYNMYKSENVKNLNMIIYPGARHELVMETNYKQVQTDVLKFFNSVVRKDRKKKSR